MDIIDIAVATATLRVSDKMSCWERRGGSYGPTAVNIPDMARSHAGRWFPAPVSVSPCCIVVDMDGMVHADRVIR